jgi:hypothetical protein
MGTGPDSPGCLQRKTNWWGAFVIGLAGTLLVTRIGPYAVQGMGLPTCSTPWTRPAASVRRARTGAVAVGDPRTAWTAALLGGGACSVAFLEVSAHGSIQVESLAGERVPARRAASPRPPG